MDQKQINKEALRLMLEKDTDVWFKKTKNGKYKWSIEYMGEEIDSFKTNFFINYPVIKKEFIESILYEGDDKFTNKICDKMFEINSKKLKEAFEKEWGAKNDK